MNISVSNIEKVFLTAKNVKGPVKQFIEALEYSEIPYDVHGNGTIEVVFLDNPIVEHIEKKLERLLRTHVTGFSKVVWKSSPINCSISNIKALFIEDLSQNLSIPARDFERKLSKLGLGYKYTGHSFALYLKHPNFTFDLQKYTSDFEHVLTHVRAIDTVNWQS